MNENIMRLIEPPVAVEPSTIGSTTDSKERSHRSLAEQRAHDRLLDLSQTLMPQLGPFWNSHQSVLLTRQSLSRLIYYNDLYQQILEIPGVICEFGVQWGATMATLINLRGMFEPFNHSRHIFGFDTFAGFARITEEDGHGHTSGDFATLVGYEQTLEEILALHETLSPISHIRKFTLIKGDASTTAAQWLESHPHAIISMLILDMDVYEPTRDVLQMLRPRLANGALIVFDELSCPNWPGETRALQEVFGTAGLRLRRHPHQPYCAFATYKS
jgi:hypothetical protein